MLAARHYDTVISLAENNNKMQYGSYKEYQ